MRFRALNRAPTVPNPALHRADPTLLAENSQGIPGEGAVEALVVARDQNHKKSLFAITEHHNL